MRGARPHALVVLLAGLLLASGSTHAAAAGAPLTPEDTYTVNTASESFVLAPSVGWNATLIKLTSADVAGCAEACGADPQCMLFNHCDMQVRRGRRSMRLPYCLPAPLNCCHCLC